MNTNIDAVLNSYSFQERVLFNEIIYKISRNYPKITIQEFMQEELEFSKKFHSKKTLPSIISCFKQLKEKFGGDTLIQNLDWVEVQNYLLDKYQNAPHGSHLMYRTLKSSFNRAKKKRYVQENIFDSIKIPKIPVKKKKVLTAEQFASIIKFEADTQFKFLYKLAECTGMRESEIIHAKWSWIDFTEEVITVENDEEFTTKSKNYRDIPFSPKLRQLLTEIKLNSKNTNAEDYIFYKHKGIKLSNDTVTKKFKMCVRQAEVDDCFHFHSLRDLFTANLLNEGHSIYAVSKLLGHSSVKVTERYYASLNLSTLRSVMQGGKNE